jgi:hypothetical protein
VDIVVAGEITGRNELGAEKREEKEEGGRADVER